MSFYPQCPTVRLVYDYRREGAGSRGSWKLYMLKKGSGIFVAEEKGVFPQSITVPTWSEKNGWKCIRDMQNHLLSISLIVIKYKIIHYTEVPRININKKQASLWLMWRTATKARFLCFILKQRTVPVISLPEYQVVSKYHKLHGWFGELLTLAGQIYIYRQYFICTNTFTINGYGMNWNNTE